MNWRRKHFFFAFDETFRKCFVFFTISSLLAYSELFDFRRIFQSRRFVNHQIHSIYISFFFLLFLCYDFFLLFSPLFFLRDHTWNKSKKLYVKNTEKISSFVSTLDEILNATETKSLSRAAYYSWSASACEFDVVRESTISYVRCAHAADLNLIHMYIHSPDIFVGLLQHVHRRVFDHRLISLLDFFVVCCISSCLLLIFCCNSHGSLSLSWHCQNTNSRSICKLWNNIRGKWGGFCAHKRDARCFLLFNRKHLNWDFDVMCVRSLKRRSDHQFNDILGRGWKKRRLRHEENGKFPLLVEESVCFASRYMLSDELDFFAYRKLEWLMSMSLPMKAEFDWILEKISNSNDDASSALFFL